jgi:hypothetical protein
MAGKDKYKVKGITAAELARGLREEPSQSRRVIFSRGRMTGHVTGECEMGINSGREKGRQDANAGKSPYVPPRVPYQTRQAYFGAYRSQTQFLKNKKNGGKR